MTSSDIANSSNPTPIDMEFLKTIIEDDEEFKKELFGIFTENSNRNIEKLEEAIKSNNDNSWYMASHAFKGAASSIGAFSLANILEYAQKHPEENAEQKAQILAKIKKEMLLVLEFIQKN
jgi:HPt (histidine-containing phosphotransfer) domain-containing protein